ncbi:tumor protein p53-inducible protein 13 isoform X2 [Pyxicephalus adspersus]|uniref:tumor protein p53-inducible protein 13 isoform X2 n=1 Tax=Pyxicephalus adspersus TaxID=30357 RepID=UPI003B5CF126
MWRLCAVCALLVAPGHARSVVCDDGRSNIQLDLPAENVYFCAGDFILPSNQMYPSIATKYKEENTYPACMDEAINYTAQIPNSGAHRSILAKYGEYIFCPPQRWVHNLKHGGVAFLYHPCVDPQLKEALSLVARSCVPRHIITPFPSLSRERPIALASWCSTLEMSYINVTEIRNWLKENVPHDQQLETVQDGAYQHLLIRPSLMSSDSTDLCHREDSQNHRRRSVWQLLRKRRRAVLVTTAVVLGAASEEKSASDAPSTLTGHHVDKTTTTVKPPARTNSLSSPTESFTPSASDILIQDSHTPGIKASVHSRETEENDNMAKLPVQKIVPTPANQSVVLPDGNMTQSVGSNVSPKTGKEHPLQLAVTTKGHLANLSQKEMSINTTQRPNATQQPQHALTSPKLSHTTAEKMASGGQKQECSCQRDTPAEVAKAQRRLGNSQKSSKGFVATPRTEEATWAAASLIFLFCLLTFSVLYTQIYRKFRKSQSLYWASGSHSEDKETVASIIKRRLVQGHSRRKKWFGRKKNPTVLYESLSESSD